MYVTAEEYRTLSRSGAISYDNTAKELQQAERDIDTLTYNRIRKIGFDQLTEFQQQLIRQAVVDQADFNAEYSDMLNNPLSSYGINGVSMAWDHSKVKIHSGIPTLSRILSLLDQTGLTYMGVR